MGTNVTPATGCAASYGKCRTATSTAVHPYLYERCAVVARGQDAQHGGAGGQPLHPAGGGVDLGGAGGAAWVGGSRASRGGPQAQLRACGRKREGGVSSDIGFPLLVSTTLSALSRGGPQSKLRTGAKGEEVRGMAGGRECGAARPCLQAEWGTSELLTATLP